MSTAPLRSTPSHRQPAESRPTPPLTPARRISEHPVPVSDAQACLPAPPFLHRLGSGLDGVALWSCSVADLPAAALAHPGDLDLLSPDELDRLRRLRFPKDRDIFLATRVLVRSALSQHAPVAPQDWVFTRSPLGRPEIAPSLRLRFSLARSGSHAVCAVTHTGDVGVDLECTRRHLPVREIAPGILAPPELLAFQQTPMPLQTALFLKFWTLKEAYAKARGLGLNLDVSRIAFTDLDSGHIRLELLDHALAVAPADDPGLWRLRAQPLFDRYACAIAHRS